jgi:hypothetical protein
MIQSTPSLRAQRGNPSSQAVSGGACTRRLIAAALPRNDGVKKMVILNLIQDLVAMLSIRSCAKIAGQARNDGLVVVLSC